MKRLFKILGGGLGLLILAVLAAALIYTLGGPKENDDQEVTFQSPIPTNTPPSSPIPTPTSGFIPPPICEFEVEGNNQNPETESLLDKYEFSKPKVILSNEAAIEISQWLPDSRRVLISRAIPDEGVWAIETVDVKTEKTKGFGGGRLLSPMPAHKFVWLNAGDAAVYVAFDANNQYALQISQEGNLTTTVATDLASGYLAANPDGKQVTYVARTNLMQPQAFDVTTTQTQTVNPESTLYLLAPSGYIDFRKQYQIDWHPDGQQYAYFNDQAFYLVNTENGKICEVDLGIHNGFKGWSLFAQWSSDGRYLALLTTAGVPPVPFIDLSILDTFTGEYYSVELEDSENKYTFTWAPNDRDILIIAGSSTNADNHNLYIVDVVTGDSRRILEDYPFMFTADSGVAWSPDGKSIAVRCPIDDKHPKLKQLCTIKVKVK